ncbi:Bifunctional inhibitor/lipid-transfer protein/seed storage 2S albumin superfamily protein [Euphorbia peplus]|nr:Bifunctional inhibitor/lipid-transfer protein/seed storage 2S albumin superfamily protein [Euphorbia peplus]
MKVISFSGMKVVAAAVMMLVIFSEMHMSDAACDVSQLSSCASAITSNVPPSGTCCSKLKAQQPCLCGYMKNPKLKPYISSPGAQKVAKTCDW